MASDRLVLTRYAKALHALAQQQGQVDRVGEELATLSETVSGNGELRLNLSRPQLSRESKKRLLRGVMGEQASDLARRVVMLLTDKGRAASVGGLGPVYHDIAMESQGRALARVTTAVPMSQETREQLLAGLRQLTGKTITLDESVEADLLGGVRIVLGSRMIDGSLKRRLETLGDRLFRVPLGAGR